MTSRMHSQTHISLPNSPGVESQSLTHNSTDYDILTRSKRDKGISHSPDLYVLIIILH